MLWELNLPLEQKQYCTQLVMVLFVEIWLTLEIRRQREAVEDQRLFHREKQGLSPVQPWAWAQIVWLNKTASQAQPRPLVEGLMKFKEKVSATGIHT